MSEPPAAAPRSRMRIWDWPTRAFHWLLVLLIPALWWTAENGAVAVHILLGLSAFALLLFRLIWGVIGSSTARFANFLTGPRAVASYLNGGGAHALGHNPLGGWSVAAMLALLTAQVGLGLFATAEDGDLWGPLALWVDEATSERLTELHAWLFNALLALIVLHIAAILFYALRRRNLVAPMLTGSADAPDGAAPMTPAPAWRLVAALAISLAAAAWLYSRA